MRHILLTGAAIAGVSAAVPLFLDGGSGIAPVPSISEVSTPVASPTKADPSSSPAGRRVDIAADQSGHFRAELKFNGRRVDGLIDTGATFVAINESTARRIGLAPARSEFRHEVSTANGKAKAAVVRIDTVEIGRIRVKDVDAIVLEDRSLQTTLIGMNVLKRLARFEVKGEVLRLEQ